VVDHERPVAEVRPVVAVSKELRPYGLYAGQFRVPDDFNEKLGAMRPALGSVWPLYERTADEELRKLCEPGQHPWEFSPEEYSA